MIPKSTIPQAARIDVDADNATLVHFTTRLLELIMRYGHNTDLKMNKGRDGIHRIFVGDKVFSAPDEDEVLRQFLYFILTAKPQMTTEEYAERAVEVLKQEALETEALLDQLAEGGMTDFGLAVQKHRVERGGRIDQALRDLKTGGFRAKDVNELLEAVAEKTGYEDIDMNEIVVGLQFMRQMEHEFGGQASS